MKRIQIQKALLFSLLFSSALYAEIIDRIEYKLGRVLKNIEGLVINGNTSSNCTPITQADFVSGVYTVAASGAYCVTENLTGLIAIEASSVCIDLDCHNVSAGGNANAFTVTGQSGIRISNGSVSNSSVAGILATNCTGVELSNLFMNQNSNDAIQLNSCTEVNVYNVNVFGGLGVRALGILSSSEVVVENCQMGGFVVSTGTGILEIISSNVVAVRNVEVANNNFVTGPVGGGIHLVTSSNVVIEHSSSNFAIGLSGTDAPFLIHGILIDSCSDCTVSDCQLNGNSTNGVEILGTYGGLDTLAILECTAMNNGGIGFDINASTVMAAGTCLIQNCLAMSNTNYGFVSSPGLLQTVFIGNVAQNNGNGTTSNNYSIFGGIIGLYELSRATGLMTYVNGQPTISSWTNMSVVPV